MRLNDHEVKVGDKMVWRYERQGCEKGELLGVEVEFVDACENYFYCNQKGKPRSQRVIFMVKTWEHPEHDYKLYRDEQHCLESDECFQIAIDFHDMYSGDWMNLGIEKLRKIKEIISGL